ncbi:MAG: hypothetical protein V7695_15140 [Sulfitobacter sp.]
MSGTTSIIEIIDFKMFPQKLKSGAVGMVFGKISHGMTVNFFSDLIYPFHLDADGQPKISLEHAINAIRYSAASEVLLGLQFLQGHNWFEPTVQFSIYGFEPYEKIGAVGWAEDWGVSAQVDLAYYLEDVCKELELAERAFSQEWYYAKVANLFFIDIDIPDVAMTVGILLSQLWWKLDLEDAALRGNANAASLEKANQVRKALSVSQSRAKNDIVAEYWHEALAEIGSDAMRRDSNAAHAVLAIALRKRPKELQIKSSGDIIGADAIRKHICVLRKLGKIG